MTRRGGRRIIATAPAKVNLHLRVGGLCHAGAHAGFHPVWSWAVSIGLFDNLSLSWTNAPPGTSDAASSSDEATEPWSVRLRCDDPTLPTDERNLVVRAIRRFQQALTGRSTEDRALRLSLEAELHKCIPSGAGLGGGSSDAACVLKMCNALCATPLADAQLTTLAGAIGSDVALFLELPSVVSSGRGEIVRQTPAPAPRHALLILPDLHMSTPAVYAMFDALNPPASSADAPAPPEDFDCWPALDAPALLEKLVNDLEPAAFKIAPQLQALRSSLQSCLGRPVRMSGSGSTLFTLFDSPDEAQVARDRWRCTPASQVGLSHRTACARVASDCIELVHEDEPSD